MADPDPYAGSIDEDAASPKLQPQPTRNYRGRTWMNIPNRKKSQGTLKPVQYN